MLVGVRMPVTMRVAVLMRMIVFMRMVMSIPMVVAVFILMVMNMRMRDARRMQCFMLLLCQFMVDGFGHSILDIFSFFLSSPRHYSTSSASTNTLMV